MRLGRYLGYGSSLEAYLWIDNIISDDNLGLNLYIIYTVYYKIITLDGQR